MCVCSHIVSVASFIKGTLCNLYTVEMFVQKRTRFKKCFTYNYIYTLLITNKYFYRFSKTRIFLLRSSFYFIYLSIKPCGEYGSVLQVQEIGYDYRL